MGLDMYLAKRTYVKRWDHIPADMQYQVEVTRGGHTVPSMQINSDRISYVEEEIGYWRKANAIHRWFVENVQNDRDECQESYVGREKLELLLEDVRKVIAASNLVDGMVETGSVLKDGKLVPEYEPGKVIEDPTVAQELLPTQAGFFFGDTSYDEWYYEHLLETEQILVTALEDPDAHDFGYQSSW